LDAGELSLYMPHAAGRWGLLRLSIRALIGRLRQAQDLDALCAKAISIDTHRKRMQVAVDGEVTVMSTPLHYRVRPGALRVIVPESAHGKKQFMCRTANCTTMTNQGVATLVDPFELRVLPESSLGLGVEAVVCERR
jgi:hypothetical protein